MTIASALAELQANDEKRKRALAANAELLRLFDQDLIKLQQRLRSLADEVEKFALHTATLLEGQAEDLNDEPLQILGDK